MDGVIESLHSDEDGSILDRSLMETVLWRDANSDRG
jgi:hypothetical protein